MHIYSCSVLIFKIDFINEKVFWLVHTFFCIINSSYLIKILWNNFIRLIIAIQQF